MSIYTIIECIGAVMMIAALNYFNHISFDWANFISTLVLMVAWVSIKQLLTLYEKHNKRNRND